MRARRRIVSQQEHRRSKTSKDAKRSANDIALSNQPWIIHGIGVTSRLPRVVRIVLHQSMQHERFASPKQHYSIQRYGIARSHHDQISALRDRLHRIADHDRVFVSENFEGHERSGVQQAN
jgi:hypothetical protein